MPSASAKPASPWVIDTGVIGLSPHDGPGHLFVLDLTAPAPTDTVSGVLTVTDDVTVAGRLESVSEGVIISATASADAEGSCARCLIDITIPVDVELRELYAYPDSTTARTTEPDEVPRLDGDLMDIEPLVHDEIVLAMPAIPLCRPDCPGLCPDCGARMEEVGDDHRHEILDPRWAALAGMLDPKQKEK